MSTEEKKVETLSGKEMSGVAGGARGSSKDGTQGGGEFLVGKAGEELSDAELSRISGGRSRDGSSGGCEFLVDQQDGIWDIGGKR